jgi:neurotrimin
LPLFLQPRWQWVQYDSFGKAQTKKISQDTAIEDNTKHSIEKPTEFTWRLRIKAIQVSDEGNYTCYVQTTLQNRKFDNRTISVLGKFPLRSTQSSKKHHVLCHHFLL